MDHAPLQDTHQSKSSMLWHREHGDESVDKRPTDSSASPLQDEMRPIRRVRSPSRPRAWISNHYKSKFRGQLYRSRYLQNMDDDIEGDSGCRKLYSPLRLCHFPRDDHSSKPGFGHQSSYHLHPRTHFHRRDHFQPKHHHIALRERKREKEKERYEQRDGSNGSSLPKQNGTTRAFLPRPTSSRDKDMQVTAGQSNRNQSRERDHRGTKSKERERSREGELPSTASQTVARDRAIQQKRKEIDEVYYQECETFGLVAKMLIAKDQSLERSIQSSLQENLRDIGKRCVEAMEKFIEDYDSREMSH